MFLDPMWSDGALRPAGELERVDGKRVRAAGVVHVPAPEPVAAIVSTYVHPVEAVDLDE